jgi:hypothetical protein
LPNAHNPPQDGIKFFSTAEVTEMAEDRPEQAMMAQTIRQQWHRRIVRQLEYALENSGSL